MSRHAKDRSPRDSRHSILSAEQGSPPETQALAGSREGRKTDTGPSADLKLAAGGPHHFAPARILIALPAIAVSVTTEMTACNSMSALARLVSGGASAGPNPKLAVKA